MSKIKEDTLLISYDDSIGVVYYPEKGAISTTTPEHAQVIRDVYADYLSTTLSADDSKAFEEYIERAFLNKPDLPLADYPSVLERTTLGRLEIMLANDCNLRCKYCYAQGGSYGKTPQIMHPDNVRTYLEQLLIGQYQSIRTVMLFGGEPTLAPKTIMEICTFFEENVAIGIFNAMPTFTMVTNGTLIDGFLVEVIKRYDIKVTVSIDGPPEINDRLRVDRAGEGTYARIERGIRLLQQAGCPPRMIEATYTSLHEQLGYEREDIKKYIEERFGVEYVKVEDCSSTRNKESNDKNEQLACHKTVQSLSNKKYELPYDENELSVIAFQNALAKTAYHDIACGAGINSFALMPDGEIYPCHFFIGYPEFCMATYQDETFDFSNYQNVLKALMPAHKLHNTRCRNCWAKPLCKSCPASLLLHSYDTDINNSFCEVEQLYLEKMILLFAKNMKNTKNE